MKKLLLPLAAAALAAGLATAAPASADESSYLQDLANNGFDGPTSAALSMGYEICTDVKHGVPQDTTVEAIYNNTADSVGVDEATFIYEAAVIHLC
ncbi:DUF732 domain-containing protein [Mycobacterium sp. M26]|uniref:DUF732 domain-containing protein n=1 Tax=Mycobacterium sp. M26 TaxID=1762962 RepID=UPI00073E4C79|nr:DUF732 domain-containing protein [Mycobacterium sp. M26]